MSYWRIRWWYDDDPNGSVPDLHFFSQLHKLCTGKDVRTVTSMTASSLNWVDVEDKSVNKMNQSVEFVDVPGYYRLLGQVVK